MSLVTITETASASPAQHREWCERLESGCILFFPNSPIALTDSDLQFLRGQQQSDSSLHKNIAYKPKADELSGVDTKTANPAADEHDPLAKRTEALRDRDQRCVVHERRLWSSFVASSRSRARPERIASTSASHS